ncbi:DNA cross-link repair 1A protein [Drosophila santomea]|uniref:DNA cross-link repair 1A protein n=1 Tax=Drosophila santomea TaxID=129105 RepID=UPI00195436B3|nr:DNA cross-link repair 1A protein [Drosophila santomea]
MSNIGKIKIKAIADLQATTRKNVQPEPPPTTKNRTPEQKGRGRARAASTTKKIQPKAEPCPIIASTALKRSSKKTPLPGQLRIDSFFTSAVKNYKVNMVPNSSSKTVDPPLAKRKGNPRGRKRLFEESTSISFAATDKLEAIPSEKRVQPSRRAKGKENALSESDVIDLCSEDEQTIKTKPSVVASPCQTSCPVIASKLKSPEASVPEAQLCSPKDSLCREEISHVPTKSSSNNSSPSSTVTITKESPLAKNSKKGTGRKQKKPKPCPPYKVVEGTTFCVDGFQFGDIDRVTHYFLTHFHADHYIGLTKKFCYPLYVSPTTARLVRTFIKIDETYIYEIDVDQTLIVDGVEVTALEANHCPGALMFFFKLRSGECILHTGDFRASADMESLPIFWNHANIDLLYLDTTYLNKNYDFCHQSESVDRAVDLVRVFLEKNASKRILIVCGSYVIGKEKIWLALAKEFTLRVWTESNRSTAVRCLKWPELDSVLTEDPREANLHVVAMGKISYPSLVDYFSLFEDQYDMLLGIRPSGWEKNTKPSYGKRISTIGIEYSEHSSYKELERFVRFLKPKRVISTVPVGRDLFVTGDVPTQWYKYEGRACMLSTGYQPSISTFLATPKRALAKFSSDIEVFLSPVEENAFEGNKDSITDHVTIMSSPTEEECFQNDCEIPVKNEPLEPDSFPNSEIVAGNNAMESQIPYVEIDIKNETLTQCNVIEVQKSEAVLLSRLTSDASDDWLL